MCIKLTLRTITEVSAGLFAALCVLIALDAGQPEQSLASDASEGFSVFNHQTVFEHQTDFLSVDECANNGMGTMFYPTASSSSRRACRRALKERGYQHIYLSVASEFYNYYDDASEFKRLLRELKEDGLKPVL